MHRLEDRAVLSDVRSGREAQTPDESRNLIGENVAKEIGGDDDVEAFRMEHEVHRHRVDDALLELDASRIVTRDHAALVEEESLRELENVRLVHERHLATAVLHGVVERVPDDPLRALSRDDRDRLGRGAGIVADLDVMLDADVEPFGVLANEHQIEILISSAGQDRICGADVRI